MRFKIQINGIELPNNMFLSEKEYVPKKNFINILSKKPLLSPLYHDNMDTMRELKLRFFVNGNTNEDIYEAIIFFERMLNKKLIITYKNENTIEDESYIVNIDCEYTDITGKAYINCTFLVLTSFGTIEVTNADFLNKAVGVKHPIERIDCTKVTEVSNYPLVIRPFGITIQAPCIVDFVGGVEIFKTSNRSNISSVFVQPFFYKRDKNVIDYTDKNQIVYPYTDKSLDNIKYTVRLRTPLL